MILYDQTIDGTNICLNRIEEPQGTVYDVCIVSDTRVFRSTYDRFSDALTAFETATEEAINGIV